MKHVKRYPLLESVSELPLYYRQQIAQDQDTHSVDLIELSRDRDERVRVYAAKNPNLPMEQLIELSKDPYDFVRAAAMSNPAWPDDLEQWALNLDDWS